MRLAFIPVLRMAAYTVSPAFTVYVLLEVVGKSAHGRPCDAGFFQAAFCVTGCFLVVSSVALATFSPLPENFP